ncbi:hypothetical protein RUM43_014640 [Polyplax serrata]|uniref:Uncharacterized protein n=1 Tax=Polyplax serrata TaxID=468196 RepID=A0AAN8S3K2_POLSC
MTIKVVYILLAVCLAVVSAFPRASEQAEPDFTQFFNQLQEHLKPISSNFPSPPSGEGFGNIPFFSNFFGQNTHTPSKRETNQPSNIITEWLEQLGQGFGQGFGQGNFPNPIGQNGNLPFQPPNFGQFPFGNFGGNGNGNGN